jgi:hypothetical protein
MAVLRDSIWRPQAPNWHPSCQWGMVVGKFGNGLVPSHMLYYCKMPSPFLHVGHGHIPDAEHYHHFNACSAFVHADGCPGCLFKQERN